MVKTDAAAPAEEPAAITRDKNPLSFQEASEIRDLDLMPPYWSIRVACESLALVSDPEVAKSVHRDGTRCSRDNLTIIGQ
jgi:hypothetical protein